MATPLLVLNASAGSGKTYMLVMTYLKLILAQDDNPAAFSQIVAMTFTNKAAQEMKHRIIEALDVLANPTRDTEQQREDSRKYLNEVSDYLQIDPNIIHKRAKKALKFLLHNYEDFTVLNTDKFNLRLIKSFERDLDVPSDFEVVMDTKTLIDEVLDEMLEEVSVDSQKSEISKLIIAFVKQKLDDETKWDVKADLSKMAQNLNEEKYEEIIPKLLATEYSEVDYQEIRRDIEAIDKKIQDQAKSLYHSFETLNLPSAGNTTLITAFEKLIDIAKRYKEKRANTAEPNHFFSSSVHSKINDNKKQLWDQQFIDEFNDFQSFFQIQIQRYHQQMQLRKNFYNLSLLKHIAKRISEHKSYKHLIQINEFNQLISRLIQDEEAPYIYERLGTRYKHFLLDEFQDTSHTQWLNTVPLIHESIANGHDNLIVGDPKQSIYRFRNGLAEQFVELPGIHNPKGNPFIAQKSNYFRQNGRMDFLEDNYRSKKEVVRFNNAFFTQLKESFAKNVKDFYDGVSQNPKGKDGGYVKVISNLSGVEEQDSSAESYLRTWVEDCISDGYEPGDICILDYKKQDCNHWASILTGLGYQVVSVDSLLVSSDAQVQLAMLYLNWRANPKSKLVQKQFANKYLSIFEGSSIDIFSKYEAEYTNEKGEKYAHFDFDLFLKAHFTEVDTLLFPYESLYGLLQSYYHLLGLEELKNPYLHHLSDLVYQYELNFATDLDSYLEHYETYDKNSSVQIAENRHAIKLMTGHKSKGLEFKVVIMPNLKWKLQQGSSQYLIEDEDRIYFTNISQNSPITAVRDFYEVEDGQSLLDKINLCYVMMTRAKDRLYVCNLTNSSKGYFSENFHQVLESMDGDFQEDGTIVMEAGTLEKVSQQLVEEANNEFVPIPLGGKLWFPDIALRENILHSDDEAESEEISYGIQLHYLISMISDVQELDRTFEALVLENRVERKMEERLKADLLQLFSTSEYTDLFVGAKEVLNEQVILVNESDMKRIDKLILKEDEWIVIDFKTGAKSAKHAQQIRKYLAILNDMYPQKNRGVLIYTSPLEFVYY